MPAIAFSVGSVSMKARFRGVESTSTMAKEAGVLCSTRLEDAYTTKNL
jgi:hypothetical protein